MEKGRRRRKIRPEKRTGAMAMNVGLLAICNITVCITVVIVGVSKISKIKIYEMDNYSQP